MFNFDDFATEVQSDEADHPQVGQCRGCAENDYLNDDDVCLECEDIDDHQRDDNYEDEMLDFYAEQSYEDCE